MNHYVFSLQFSHSKLLFFHFLHLKLVFFSLLIQLLEFLVLLVMLSQQSKNLKSLKFSLLCFFLFLRFQKSLFLSRKLTSPLQLFLRLNYKLLRETLLDFLLFLESLSICDEYHLWACDRLIQYQDDFHFSLWPHGFLSRW